MLKNVEDPVRKQYVFSAVYGTLAVPSKMLHRSQFFMQKVSFSIMFMINYISFSVLEPALEF
jgi:hypothetical protein